MHCWGECEGKGTANHFKTELNPQVPPVGNVLTRDQETNWTVNLSIFLPCICILSFLVFVQMALVRPYCRDIVQSSLVHHHKPWFQQEDQTCKLLSTTGSLGITNTCTKPAPYIIICYYRSFQGSTMLTGPEVLQWKSFILEPSVFIPRGGHSRTFQLEGM